jgi:hypothetical protein
LKKASVSSKTRKGTIFLTFFKTEFGFSTLKNYFEAIKPKKITSTKNKESRFESIVRKDIFSDLFFIANFKDN